MSVSVIIPIYKVEDYIDRCARSVFEQTYSDIEYIFVNDCTPDRSIEILEHVMKDYPERAEHVIILNHEQNMGHTPTRNDGMKAATGEWLFFMDADDVIVPECISLLYEEAQKYRDVEMVMGFSVSIPSIAEYEALHFMDKYDYIDNNLKIRQLTYRVGASLPPVFWNKLIRRSFIIDNSLYSMGNIIYQDNLWFYRVSQKLNKLAFCHVPTYLYYCKRENSTVNGASRKKLSRSWSYICRSVIEHLDEPLRKQQVVRYWYCLLSFCIPSGNMGLIMRYTAKLIHYNCFGLLFVSFIYLFTYPLHKGNRFLWRVKEKALQYNVGAN